MEFNNLSDQVIHYLLNDNLESAFDLLLETTRRLKYKVLEEEILIIRARYNELKKQRRVGVIGLEEYNIQKNRIRRDILEVLSEIENNLTKQSQPEEDEFAEFGEKRTRLIGLYSQIVFENISYGIIRQMGGFSSFSIPNRNVKERIWQIRKGKIERETQYHEYQRLERIWIEKISKTGYCKLIIAPNLLLEERGKTATASRIKTLIEFVESHKDIVDIITDESVIDLNLLIVGNSFFAESEEGDAKYGYKNTVFKWNENDVQRRISFFDNKFDTLLLEQELDTFSAREKALSDLYIALENLRYNQKTYLLSNCLNSNKTLNWGEQDILKYIKYDSVPIYIREENYIELSRELKRFSHQKNNLNDKIAIKKIFCTIPIDEEEPNKFCRAILTRDQYYKLINYIHDGNFYQPSLGLNEIVNIYIAFSFGEDEIVNRKIAEELGNVIERDSKPILISQWEVEDHIKDKEKFQKIIRVEKENKEYLKTEDVIKKAIDTLNKDIKNVAIAAQSWHAPRCIGLCKNRGLNVVKVVCIDKFSPSDKQPWTRDVLSWIIKESQK